MALRTLRVGAATSTRDTLDKMELLETWNSQMEHVQCAITTWDRGPILSHNGFLIYRDGIPINLARENLIPHILVLMDIHLIMDPSPMRPGRASAELSMLVNDGD